MDKKTEMEICSVVRTAITKALNEQQEVWLGATELCKQFQFLTPSWLKRFGKLLPYTYATVTGPDGSVSTRLAWGRNAIQGMIRDGRMQALMTEKCVYKCARK